MHDLTGPVLVTGAGGYLGGRITRALRARGIATLALGRRPAPGIDVVVDLANGGAVRAALGRHAPAWIVHAAAHVPRSLDAYGDEAAAMGSADMVRHLCAALGHARTRLLLVSSMTVYGPDAPCPVRENAPTRPATAYARGKLEAERIASSAGIAGYAVRIPGLYGPPREGGLVANLARAMRSGEPPRLPEAPLQWAGMHVADAADAFLALLATEPTRFEPVNVGYGGPVSIDRMVRIMHGSAVARGAGPSSHEAAVDRPAVIHPTFEYDLTRWRELTGIEPVPFAHAVGRMVA